MPPFFLFSGLDTHCTWLSQRPEKGSLIQPSGNALGTDDAKETRAP